ncbi:S1 family peptidase [Nocardioides baculatus]|uniref:Trypsin-like serine protease n=1 Tax=Nocardioides baculatus TaxID=2801337 RepID=A0ABS1L3K1_9ACTN|nr:trypsin-like serine protease [Nocardioides baculatus]MBL0746275.1 trypsin-like serine protease [Nocardioides baculatus]
MRSRLKAAMAVLVTALTLGAMTAAPAAAVTGGTPDGDAHPNVGLILFYDGTGRFRCSATLVTPTVLLTAAHCTDGTKGKTLVDFRSVVKETGPSSGYAAAADPANGYTQAEIEAAGFRSGTAYTHPEYSDFTDLDNWNDVGVIVLDRPVTGIEPAKIAPLNYLDDYAQPRLNKTIFTSVGYGTEVRKPDSGPQKPTPMTFPLIRRYADQPGQKLTDQILQLNGNPNDTKGTGGTCFGDSGGPTFLNGYLVTVTSYAYTDNCRYLGGYQRVDIEVAQDWLAPFLATS